MYPDSNPTTDPNDPNFWEKLQKESTTWWKEHLKHERQLHAGNITTWKIIAITFLVSGMVIGLSVGNRLADRTSVRSTIHEGSSIVGDKSDYSGSAGNTDDPDGRPEDGKVHTRHGQPRPSGFDLRRSGAPNW